MESVEVAVGIALQHGLDVSEPVLLRSTNNTVVWLAPCPVVAKVSDGSTNRLAYELDVGRRLAQIGAPVGAPDPDLGSQVHRRDGYSVTFWQYLDADAQPGPGKAIAHTLARFHERAQALAEPDGVRLPSFDQGASDVRRRLDDPQFAPGLSPDERALLCRTLDALNAERLASDVDHLVLHGSPHSYNVVFVGGDAILIDLESVCAGPLEWDLAHLDPGVAANYTRAVDFDLMKTCRTVIEACTAAWCMEDIDRGPDMEWHARTHLASVSRWAGADPA